MAEVTDDMRVMKFATRPFAAPTSIPAINPNFPAIKTFVNFLDDLNSLVSTEEPYSVKADEQGVQIGDFLVNNIELATAVKSAREKLDDLLNEGFCNQFKKILIFQSPISRIGLAIKKCHMVYCFLHNQNEPNMLNV